MPLTAIERAELNSLRTRRDATKQPLSDLEKLELQSLRQRKQFDVVAQPISPEEEDEYRQQEWLQQQIAEGKVEPAKTEPSFWERFKEYLPQGVGGMAGGLAGAKTGAMAGAKIPAGHPLLKGAAVLGGAVLGAGVGGAGGKGYQQYYRMTRPGAKAQPLSELYTEQIIAGIEEGAAELVGRGVAKGIGVAGRAVGRKIVSPGAKAAAELLRKSKLGITLAQATDNRTIDLLESIAEGSLIGGGKLQKLKTLLIPKAIKKAVSSLSDDFAAIAGKLTPEEAGELLLDTLNRKNTAFKRASRSIYKQVDKLIKKSGQTGEIVNVSALKKFAQNRLKSKVNVLRSTTGDTLLESILALPDNVTFKQASSLRSALLTQARTMSATKDVALGATKQLAKLTDSAIENAGKQLSGDAFDMWRFANKFHREGKEIFNSKLIKGLGKALADNPEKAVSQIFQKGASKQIVLLKNTVDEPTWNVLRHGYIEKILNQAKNADGVLQGKKFLNSLDNDVLRAAFNPEEIASIKTLGRSVELLQRPAAAFGATGRLVVAISQARLISGGALYLTGHPGTATTILLSPYALGRIATSKKWSKLLIEGLKDPIKFSGSLTRLTKVVLKLDAENMIRQRQKQGKRAETLPPLRERLNLAKTGEELLKIFE